MGYVDCGAGIHFSYFSIEMIAVAAGEARDPHLAITRAFRATMFRLAFFYLLTLALIVAMAPWTAANTGQSPFVKVMAVTHVPGAAGVDQFRDSDRRIVGDE